MVAASRGEGGTIHPLPCSSGDPRGGVCFAVLAEETALRVTALNLYPVKSMRGLAVPAAELGLQGFDGDREWLLVDVAGRFLSAREIEPLLLWRPQPTPDGRGLRLAAPDGDALEVQAADYTRPVEVTVWKDRFEACAGPDAADAWLSGKLGQPCRLVHLGRQSRRVLQANGQALSFADGAPYLLTTQASLAHLNARLAQPVPMARFRANIVVDGRQAYAEDGWQRLRIGGIEFTGFKPCGRCKIVNLDPDTAVLSPDREPLRTLAQTHQLAEGACFGMNLYAHAVGRLRVGDAVEILP